MLDRARALIVTEVSDVIREKAVAVEGRVDQALERCFTAKARAAQRAATRAREAEGRRRAARRAGERFAAAPHDSRVVVRFESVITQSTMRNSEGPARASWCVRAVR